MLKKILRKIFKITFLYRRYLYTNVLSSNKNLLKKNVKISQPTLFIGDGIIWLEETVNIGYYPSAYYYAGYSHIEARDSSSKIIIKKGTFINNNCNIVSEKKCIEIGMNCLIGTNFTCYNSDFHGILPDKRGNSEYVNREDVKIGNNVFIGSNVTVLKGARIGDNCVIGANSLVLGGVYPPNSIIAGSPAKILKNIVKT